MENLFDKEAMAEALTDDLVTVAHRLFDLVEIDITSKCSTWPLSQQDKDDLVATLTRAREGPVPSIRRSCAEFQQRRGDFIDRLMLYVLHELRDFKDVVFDRFDDLGLPSWDLLPTDVPVYDLVPYSDLFIVRCRYSADVEEKMAGFWCRGGEVDSMADLYLFNPFKQVLLGYIRALFEHSNQAIDVFLRRALSLVCLPASEAGLYAKRSTAILLEPNLRKLIVELPWWKYKMPSLAKCHKGRIYQLLSSKDAGKKVSPLAIEFIDPLVKSIDNEVLETFDRLFSLMRFPRFCPEDIDRYPASFRPRAKTCFLLARRFNLPKVVVRHVLLDYVLWNCFQERDPETARVEEELAASFHLSKAEMTRNYIRKGYLPSDYDDRPMPSAWNRIFYAEIMTKGVKENMKKLAKRLSRVLIVTDSKHRKVRANIDAYDMMDKLRSRIYTLRWFKRNEDGSHKIDVLCSLLGKEFTLDELADWITFPKEWDYVPGQETSPYH